MMRLILSVLLFNLHLPVMAFSWSNLWTTKNHQAQSLMNSKQFAQAEELFDDPEWKATAAFRAGHYEQAAKGYNALKPTLDSYYNQANALAHQGQLKQAIDSYDKALAIEPNHQDALYNRNIVKQLLDKQQQDKQQQDKQQQDKQQQDKQQQDKPQQDKQQQDKQQQDKQQDKQQQDKQQNTKERTLKDNIESTLDKEKQQAIDQWLRLIPDDPGGLMREKFLRDYLRRHPD